MITQATEVTRYRYYMYIKYINGNRGVIKKLTSEYINIHNDLYKRLDYDECHINKTGGERNSDEVIKVLRNRCPEG